MTELLQILAAPLQTPKRTSLLGVFEANIQIHLNRVYIPTYHCEL